MSLYIISKTYIISLLYLFQLEMFAGLLSWLGATDKENVIDSGSGDMDLDHNWNRHDSSNTIKPSSKRSDGKLKERKRVFPIEQHVDILQISNKNVTKRQYSQMDAQAALEAVSKTKQFSQRNENYIGYDQIAKQNNMSTNQLRRLISKNDENHDDQNINEINVLTRGRPVVFKPHIIDAIKKAEKESGTIEFTCFYIFIRLILTFSKIQLNLILGYGLTLGPNIDNIILSAEKDHIIQQEQNTDSASKYLQDNVANQIDG